MEMSVPVEELYTIEERLAMNLLCDRCNLRLPSKKGDRNKRCHICEEPFDSFKFGVFQGRKRQTQICWPCANVQNLCRMCLVDRESGVVPEHLRDFANKVEPRPSSPATPTTSWPPREFFISGGALVIPRAGSSKTDAQLLEEVKLSGDAAVIWRGRHSNMEGLTG